MIVPETARLERASAEEILRWAVERYAPRLMLATGFGMEGCVLIDLIARHRLPVAVCTLDTGLLFPETYDLWRRIESRYGLVVRAFRAESAVVPRDSPWERDPDACCAARKVEPMRQALEGMDAWLSGIRREHAPSRAGARIVEADPVFGLVKVNPLAAWTAQQVWQYIDTYTVPHNPLHHRGYLSIGCWPCTTPVSAGEDSRAGRWRGQGKTECGLHDRKSLS